MCVQEHLIPGAYKFDALITTFEMVLSDCPELREISWRCVIIDEAHRLKNRNCKLLDSLKMLDLVSGSQLQMCFDYSSMKIFDTYFRFSSFLSCLFFHVLFFTSLPLLHSIPSLISTFMCAFILFFPGTQSVIDRHTTAEHSGGTFQSASFPRARSVSL